MQIIKSPSPNFNDRKGISIDMLILHYTDTKTASDAMALLQDPKNEVSAHYLIDIDGTIHQLVDEEKRAWHAGKSYWDGVTDINSHSIGIELQNKGHSHGYSEFPKAQMEALIPLCHDIIKRHNIPTHRILAHSDIAPDRKQDPGYLFDWKLLAENGIGLWAEGINKLDTDKSIKELLIDFGYNPELSEDVLLNAFKQHFIRSKEQDIIKTINKINDLKI